MLISRPNPRMNPRPGHELGFGHAQLVVSVMLADIKSYWGASLPVPDPAQPPLTPPPTSP
jgi:hypothetical protein